jgi:tetratricopeptide (TPR) repeat protein
VPRQKSQHVDDPKAVGERLRAARFEAGLSQRELSFPGCSPAYISRIEAGDRVPSLQLLRELARRLDVSEDYLATGQTGPREGPVLLEAEVALRLGELDVAEQLYGEALERAQGRAERSVALAGLGQLAFRRGDPHDAIRQFEEALAQSRTDVSAQPSLAETLGRAYAMVGQLDSATLVFKRCLDGADERNDPIETMRFGVLLANTFIDTGKFEPAEELLERCLSLVRDSQDPLLRARLYWSQSRLYAMQGAPETAARYARKALELVELTDHDYYTARAHELLAHIELDRNRPHEALELLRKGWPLLEKSGNKVEQAQYRLEEARALGQLGRAEEAGSLAMEISGLLKDASPEEAGRSYGLLAEMYEDLGDPSRALELYELAADLLEKNPNRYLINVYARLANLLEAQGRKDDALEVLKRAVRAESISQI